MSDSKNTEQETTVVDDHKKMLIMTGNLSDFQLDNLKKWPFILFDQELEKVEINYDFTKLIAEKEELSPGRVSFNFTFKKNTKLSRDETKKKLELLTLWTRFLFWKETKVEFQRAGKKWEV
jgi:hypothetical protein